MQYGVPNGVDALGSYSAESLVLGRDPAGACEGLSTTGMLPASACSVNESSLVSSDSSEPFDHRFWLDLLDSKLVLKLAFDQELPVGQPASSEPARFCSLVASLRSD